MRWLLIGYMFLFIDRPFEVWPWLGDLHVERFYMLFTMAVWAVYPNKRFLPNAQHAAYFAFGAAVLLAWAVSPWSAQGQPVVEDWLKIVVFYVLLVTCIHDEEGLKHVAVGFLAVMGLYLLHSFREYLAGRHTYRMGIARMIGVDTTLGDPNSFGASIVFALPIVVALWKADIGGRRGRVLLTGYVGLSSLCILLTGSRSSLIGLLLWFAHHHLEHEVPVHGAGRVRGGGPAGVRRPAGLDANAVRDDHQPGGRAEERAGVRRGAHPGPDDGPPAVGEQPAHRHRPRRVAAGDPHRRSSRTTCTDSWSARRARSG